MMDQCPKRKKKHPSPRWETENNCFASKGKGGSKKTRTAQRGNRGKKPRIVQRGRNHPSKRPMVGLSCSKKKEKFAKEKVWGGGIRAGREGPIC